jgi:hypothetical protein
MALIKLQGNTKIQGKTIFETGPAGYSVSDANAAAYISAVEAADGASLEDPVKQAIDSFIIGCKSDGIWNSLKASCILAGARTLNGALVPLVGAAPTNFNFVSDDYNRETGLIGNGSTKYLNSRRNNNADPQDNQHLSVYATTAQTIGGPAYIGAGNSNSGQTYFVRSSATQNLTTRSRNPATTYDTISSKGDATGLLGLSRNNNLNYIFRAKQGSHTLTRTSVEPLSAEIFVYRTNGATTYSNSRLSFYSIGESIDLALLDTRVTNLMTAIQAAI